jgi:chromosome segregation ATPase
MEPDQVMKQVDWLDEERRKDKTRITTVEERVAALEGNLPLLTQQIKEMNSEITRLTALVSRMDQYDESIRQQRIEAKQYFDELERQFKKREEESEKVRRVEMRAIDSSLAELRKELDPVPEIKRNLKSRVDEDARLSRNIDELRARLETQKRSEEESVRTFRLLDDGRRQDTKRITDLQGELAVIRKRVDEQRSQADLILSNQKKSETKISELAIVEAERNEALEQFIDRQTLLQVERERVWKDWQARFTSIEGQTADIETSLQTLDETQRSIKRSQQFLDELAQKVDRRINELSEIQRLAEERFRQEWVTFRADDQKRWTNYTLTQEEQRGEAQRQNEKVNERIIHLEEIIQGIDDLVQAINETNEKQLQSLLAMAHDWVTNYERAIPRIR